MGKPSLANLESVAKIFAIVAIPILVAIIPSCVSNLQRDREIELRYAELAVTILTHPDSSEGLRKWAVDILEESKPSSEYSIPDTLRKKIISGDVTFPSELTNAIIAGEYIDVPVSNFVEIVVATKQLKRKNIESFLLDAIEYFESPSNKESITYDERWEISVGGGEVSIFRTHNKAELLRAWEGILVVLKAAQAGRNVSGVTIKIRGEERFYDINGLSGTSSRAWIALDFRQSSLD